MDAVLNKAARRGVRWWTMRLVTSQDLPDGLVAIRRSWSYADTLEAHLALDALEDAREIMRRQAEKDARRKAKGK